MVTGSAPTGNFLAEQHTAEHFRAETWIPDLLDRNSYPAWEAAGGLTLLDRARARLREILDSHEPERLNADLLKELDGLASKDNSG